MCDFGNVCGLLRTEGQRFSSIEERDVLWIISNHAGEQEQQFWHKHVEYMQLEKGHHKYDVHVISVLLLNFALTVLLIIEDEDVINSEDAKSFTLSMLIHTKKYMHSVWMVP